MSKKTIFELLDLSNQQRMDSKLKPKDPNIKIKEVATKSLMKKLAFYWKKNILTHGREYRSSTATSFEQRSIKDKKWTVTPDQAYPLFAESRQAQQAYKDPATYGECPKNKPQPPDGPCIG